MPKKKKTREEKMLADKRREPENQSLYTFTSTLSKSQEKQTMTEVKKPAGTILTTSYHYLARDLQKTLFFTLFIIAAELVIYYITRGV